MELSVSELWRYVCASDGYDTTRNPCQEAVDLVVPSGIDKGQKLLQRVSCSLTSTSSGDAKGRPEHSSLSFSVRPEPNMPA